MANDANKAANSASAPAPERDANAVCGSKLHDSGAGHDRDNPLVKNYRILLVIPCHNEAQAIGPLLDEISSHCPGYQTLVIDDGSTDETYAIAKSRSPTIRLLRNLGIGGAIQTGIKYAERNDFDCCIQVDGDGQHPPSEIAKLVHAYRESPRSIIIGSRYLTNDTYRSTLPRRAGSTAIAKALRILFPICHVTDPTSGMRLLDRAAIRLFSDRYPHDFPEPISLAWAFRAGLSVGEIPVKMRAREHGQSSIVGWKPLAYMFRVLSYILFARLTRFFRGRNEGPL